MSRLFVAGWGAVSPAGWGVGPLWEALRHGDPVPPSEMAHPVRGMLPVRKVPSPVPRPPSLAHPRFRRSSPIAQFSIAAALEAVGGDLEPIRSGEIRLGIVFAAMSGCVNYSRRFYDETLKDPATASPLVFPETVFNAPASHIAAFLGTTAASYTLVGDPGTFLQGIALAGAWIEEGKVDACLVLGAEESDWLTTSAFRLFVRRIVLAEGAGALYLKPAPAGDLPITVGGITSPALFSRRVTPREACLQVRESLGPFPASAHLVDSRLAIPRLDLPEETAWKHWTGARSSPKRILGEGLMAASAWQCICALEHLRRKEAARGVISVVGCNQQAIGAWFETPTEAASA